MQEVFLQLALKTIPIAVQAAMNADADVFSLNNKFTHTTLTTSHSPFISAPQALVTALIGLV